MNEVLKAIHERRSTRGFNDVQLTEEQLQTLIDAALASPTARNTQMWHFSFVQNKEALAQFGAFMAEKIGKPDFDPFYGAPTVCVVLADAEIYTWLEDGSLVLGNMMLAAEAVGAASCWIHRARQEFDSPEGKALLEKWGIPTHYRGIGHCILGYPAAALPAPPPPWVTSGRTVLPLQSYFSKKVSAAMGTVPQ